MKNFPIGIQSFPLIRESGDIYVDKTAKLQNLIECGRRYFLSRPRRFGKSLTISTLEAMFHGRADLFAGLAAEKLVQEYEKHPHPVLSFDMSDIDKHFGSVMTILNDKIDSIAENYAIDVKRSSFGEKFSYILEQIYKRYGYIVILVDEYDKPVLDCIDDVEEANSVREELRSFYTVIKKCDKYIYFLMLTGISKFCKTGIFSAMNNLEDISLDTDYADLYGYTQQEIEQNFREHILYASERNRLSYTEFMYKLKEYYDGFCFDGNKKVYNPFSIMLCLKKCKFDNYWYESGSPMYIINYLKKHKITDIEIFNHCEVQKDFLSSYEIESASPECFLYQSGYLTLEKETETEYILKYPNHEIKDSITALYLENVYEITKPVKVGSRLWSAFKNADLPLVVDIYNSALSSIPFEDFPDRDEYWYRSLFIMLLRGASILVHAEIHTNLGRTDIVIVFENTIFILEFKCADTPNLIDSVRNLGMKQIEEKNYAKPYEFDSRTHIKQVFIIDVVNRKIVL